MTFSQLKLNDKTFGFYIRLEYLVPGGCLVPTQLGFCDVNRLHATNWLVSGVTQ